MKEIIISGQKYQYQDTIKGRNALDLDRKVTSVFLSLDFKSNEVNQKEIVPLLCSYMGNIDDRLFEDLLYSTLNGVVVVGDEKTKSFSFSGENIYSYFFGKLNEMYELLIEVWDAAGLTVFTMGKSTGS